MELSVPYVLTPPIGPVKSQSLLIYRPATEAIVEILKDYQSNRHIKDHVVTQIASLVTQALAPWQAVNNLIQTSHPPEGPASAPGSAGSRGCAAHHSRPMSR